MTMVAKHTLLSMSVYISPKDYSSQTARGAEYRISVTGSSGSMEDIIQQINTEMVPVKMNRRRSLILTESWKTIFSGTNTHPNKKNVTFEQLVGIDGDQKMITSDSIKDYFQDRDGFNSFPDHVWSFAKSTKSCKIIIPPYSRVEAQQLVGTVTTPELTVDVFTTRVKLRTKKL